MGYFIPQTTKMVFPFDPSVMMPVEHKSFPDLTTNKYLMMRNHVMVHRHLDQDARLSRADVAEGVPEADAEDVGRVFAFLNKYRYINSKSRRSVISPLSPIRGRPIEGASAAPSRATSPVQVQLPDVGSKRKRRGASPDAPQPPSPRKPDTADEGRDGSPQAAADDDKNSEAGDNDADALPPTQETIDATKAPTEDVMQVDNNDTPARDADDDNEKAQAAQQDAKQEPAPKVVKKRKWRNRLIRPAHFDPALQCCNGFCNMCNGGIDDFANLEREAAENSDHPLAFLKLLLDRERLPEREHTPIITDEDVRDFYESIGESPSMSAIELKEVINLPPRRRRKPEIPWKAVR